MNGPAPVAGRGDEEALTPAPLPEGEGDEEKTPGARGEGIAHCKFQIADFRLNLDPIPNAVFKFEI